MNKDALFTNVASQPNLVSIFWAYHGKLDVAHRSFGEFGTTQNTWPITSQNNVLTRRILRDKTLIV